MTKKLSRLLAFAGVAGALALVLALVGLPSQEAIAVDTECVEITGSGFGSTTGHSTMDCLWAEMDARTKLGTQMSNDCRPDKVCENSIQFGTCTYNGNTYSVPATANWDCGNFF